ncbi:hypothetical protein GN95_004964 [Salmonella enterica subsp. enterica serovar Newport]|nr:hypothetical protein [Salmonella enterica subsp. enterica serovar Newport]
MHHAYRSQYVISGRDTQILTTVCGFNGDIPRSVHCSTRVNMPQSIFQ